MAQNRKTYSMILQVAICGLLISALTPIVSNADQMLKKNIAVAYDKQTPSFPKSISSYRLKKKASYDYVRIFSDSSWTVPIQEFDPNQNGGATMSCQPYFWVIRWRSNNPDVTIAASAGITDGGEFDSIYKSVIGGAGYMEGFSCVVPAFKFGKTLNRNKANLVDVNFEYQIWEYKPKI